MFSYTTVQVFPINWKAITVDNGQFRMFLPSHRRVWIDIFLCVRRRILSVFYAKYFIYQIKVIKPVSMLYRACSIFLLLLLLQSILLCCWIHNIIYLLYLLLHLISLLLLSFFFINFVTCVRREQEFVTLVRVSSSRNQNTPTLTLENPDLDIVGEVRKSVPQYKGNGGR